MCVCVLCYNVKYISYCELQAKKVWEILVHIIVNILPIFKHFIFKKQKPVKNVLLRLLTVFMTMMAAIHTAENV